jgi:signal transduction histidine kinase
MSDSQWNSGELRLIRAAPRVDVARRGTCDSDWPGWMELAASRSRIVAAADESRRRIERDLHDGVQQRLVSLLLKLRGLTASLPAELRLELVEASDELEQAMEELREVTRGIHPAILTGGGLHPALKALARRSSLPLELDLPAHQRYPGRVEVAAYYVACEALTNAVKHGKASFARLRVTCSERVLTLSIRDDGVGGADLSHGSGLIGLVDRVEAAGGTISVESPPGRGTSICVQLPLAEVTAAASTAGIASLSEVAGDASRIARAPRGVRRNRGAA